MKIPALAPSWRLALWSLSDRSRFQIAEPPAELVGWVDEKATVTRALLPATPNRRAYSDIFSRFRNQVRAEVAIERRNRICFSGWETEADVAIRTDHNHATRREAGALWIDARI